MAYIKLQFSRKSFWSFPVSSHFVSNSERFPRSGQSNFQIRLLCAYEVYQTECDHDKINAIHIMWLFYFIIKFNKSFTVNRQRLWFSQKWSKQLSWANDWHKLCISKFKQVLVYKVACKMHVNHKLILLNLLLSMCNCKR